MRTALVNIEGQLFAAGLHASDTTDTAQPQGPVVLCHA